MTEAIFWITANLFLIASWTVIPYAIYLRTLNDAERLALVAA